MKKTNNFIGTIRLFSHGILDINSVKNGSAWAFLIIRDGMEYIVSEKTYDYSEVNINIKALINALENLKEKNWNREKIIVYLTNYELMNMIITLNNIELHKLMISIKNYKKNIIFQLKLLLIFFTDISFYYNNVPNKKIDSVLRNTIRIS